MAVFGVREGKEGQKVCLEDTEVYRGSHGEQVVGVPRQGLRRKEEGGPVTRRGDSGELPGKASGTTRCGWDITVTSLEARERRKRRGGRDGSWLGR